MKRWKAAGAAGWVFGLALAGVARADSDPASLRIVPAKDMAAAFAHASMIRETALYKVHASHREAPGVAEIHTRDTDVFYVTRGSATFVTGGRAVDVKSTAPDELRGARIEGGESHTLTAGDVVIVPNGLPHWFSEVKGPFEYFVVKVTTPESAAVGADAGASAGAGRVSP